MTFAIDELKKEVSKEQIIDYFKDLSLFKNENDYGFTSLIYSFNRSAVIEPNEPNGLEQII